MGFSLDNSIVRGELFTENGKWKYTVALDMRNYYSVGPTVYQAVITCWRDGSYDGVVKKADGSGITGYWLVVPDPYHENAYPVMVKI